MTRMGLNQQEMTHKWALFLFTFSCNLNETKLKKKKKELVEKEWVLWLGKGKENPRSSPIC